MPGWGYKSTGMRRPLGGRMLRSTLQITEINGPLLSTLSPYPINSRLHSGAGFRGCDWNAELGRSYGLSPFVVVQVFDHSGPISRGCGCGRDGGSVCRV